MKLNFDLNFVEKITHIDSSQFKQKTDYFGKLPLEAQIQILYQMKIIEEEDEYAFFQQNFNVSKVGEYRFALFLLAIERLEDFQKHASRSKYSQSKVKKIEELKNKAQRGVNVDVLQAIEKRRSFRSLEKTQITKEIIYDLAKAASLAPSCFNNQPWRFLFIYEEPVLEQLKQSLSKGNEWAKNASMIIVVLSKETKDCILGDRKYYLFDTGMSVGFLLLKATHLGYVAHPIAGYDLQKVKNIINSPNDMQIITLIIFGKHKEEINNSLSERQKQDELIRPHRKPFEEFACLNKYCLKE